MLSFGTLLTVSLFTLPFLLFLQPVAARREYLLIYILSIFKKMEFCHLFRVGCSDVLSFIDRKKKGY